MERFVLVPSSRIFLAGRQEDPTTRKMLAPLKLLSLGRSVLILVLGTKQTKLVSPWADDCDDSANCYYKAVTYARRESRRAKLHVFYCRPPSLISSSLLVNPTKSCSAFWALSRIFLVLGSSSLDRGRKILPLEGFHLNGTETRQVSH